MKLFRILSICFNICNATVLALTGFSLPFYADFIMSIKDLTEAECIDECISRFDCKSLTVRPGDICILYAFRNNSQTYLGYAPYFTYLERTEIAPSYETGCKHLVCGSGQKCVVDSGCGCAYCKNEHHNYFDMRMTVLDISTVKLKTEIEEMRSRIPNAKEKSREILIWLRITYIRSQTVYKDCNDYSNAGYTTSGLYPIQLGSSSIIVWCQLDSNPSLTYIQRRYDGSVDFNRTWEEYERGFGSPDLEFWLGNKHIHQLTNDKARSIIFFFETFGGRTETMIYNGFQIANSSDEYRLSPSVVLYYRENTDLGDIFGPVKGRQFSAMDRDNDNADISCAKKNGAGWWFENCHRGNVNGPYCSGCTNNDETPKFLSWKINEEYEHIKNIAIAIF